MKIKLLAVATSCAALLLGATQAIAQMSIQMDDRGIFMESNRGFRLDYYRDRQEFRRNSYGNSFNRWGNLFPHWEMEFPQLDRWERHRGRSVETNSLLSRSEGTTAVTVKSAYLDLEISGEARTYISAEITVDGIPVKTVRGNSAFINLAPYLESGENRVEIRGYYSPASSTVRLELVGERNTITHEISGNGSLRQTLILDVR
ncbi:hypothetical protein [Phormidium sp. CCY1219]|uniref:hypothetical protein n=1 Tax=Phormidium sp. CCY1219 TaxID=2886104 RepID=UPI002D781D52|nr:hypothetical protein [Phormidium sp. CCY1219]